MKNMFSWIKAHVGIHVNELADRLAKEAARREGPTTSSTKYPRASFTTKQQKKPYKNGKPNGHIQEGGSNKTILPNSQGQTRDKIKCNPKTCSCAVGTWENGGHIFTASAYGMTRGVHAARATKLWIISCSTAQGAVHNKSS